MELKIALAGNPNCGKTTLFNALTGSNQYVGNWPGVTVEKKEGKLKGHKEVVIQDLPGIYSLSPYTLEEVVARSYLVGEKPDAILNIVDGTNIERNLYLTTQLIELGIPVVVAVNMIDLVRKSGDTIDLGRLGEALGCEVVSMSALKGEGGMAAAEKAVALAKSHKAGELPHVFTGSVEHAIAHIEESIAGLVDDRYLRWYAIKVFERDDKVMAQLNLTGELKAHLEAHIADCEKEMDDDAESIITNQRYTYINGVVNKAVKKKAAAHSLTNSDKIDRIVTNRILALPIFAVVMFAVYYVAIGTVGDWVTGWTNDVLFGEIVPPAVSGWLEGIGTAPWLQGLIVDGIIAGVGAVLGFVPQMLVLFLMLSILEDVGYMARVAFIMDRIFRKFGLSGKSFIPMLIGSGCGVPGVMASRTIENERDRRMTVMTTCFVPCGAKMPIIGLFAGALFGGSGLVAVSAYFIGVAAIIFSGIILKKTKAFAGDPAPLRYGAARLPRALCGQRPAGHLGARLVLHQAGRHHHPGLLHHPLVPPGLRLYRGGLRHGGGQQHLPAGGHWRRGVLHFPAPGLRHLAGHRGHRYRPHRQGERGVHLRRALRSGRRSDGGGPRPVGRRGHPLHRPECLQLYDLQPAVRPLLRGYGRHQAGNE